MKSRDLTTARDGPGDPASGAARGFGRALASFSSTVRFAALPEEVRTIARHCVLDWLGVTIAGSREAAARIVLAEALEQGGTPQATLLGRGSRTSVGQAALVNGTASHALDYDDVQFTWRIHASVSVLPAVLALAERDARSGADLITAFVAGVETACRVGQFVTDAHYTRGHHATGTLGTFGAAAGAAWLLGLGVEDTATALGIAATQAAGLKAMFGTMCKPLHAGKAAANGLYAALLAGRGFSSRGDGIECRHGFADTLSPVCDPERALAGLGEDYLLRNVLFKYHAACYSTHAAIEAAAQLREVYSIAPGAIARVEIRVSVSSLSICNIQEPGTGLEAKFSLRLTSAMALCGRPTAEIASFSAATCLDPELTGVRDKTQVIGDGALARGMSEVIVTMEDGTVHRQFSDVSAPNRDLEDQQRRLQDKFFVLASPVIGRARANEALAMVGGLERLERVEDLTRCLTAIGDPSA